MPETRLTVYVTAQTTNLLATGTISYDEVRKQLDLLGVEKVYLENYRTGLLVPQTHLAKVRNAFKDSYEVSGGSCIGTWGEDWGRYADFGFKVVCLTDQKNLNLIARAMKEAGEVFDEVLIDDFWANWCACSHCVAEFNREYGFSISSEMLQRALARGDNQLSRFWARFSTELFSKYLTSTL